MLTGSRATAARIYERVDDGRLEGFEERIRGRLEDPESVCTLEEYLVGQTCITFISYLTQHARGFGNAYILICRTEKGAKAI